MILTRHLCAWFFVAGGAFACSNQSAVPTNTEGKAAPSPTSSRKPSQPPLNSGQAGKPRLELRQSSVLPGTTAAGTTPRVLFEATFTPDSTVPTDTLGARVAQLDGAFSFIDKAGTKTGAILDVHPSKEQLAPTMVQVTPAQALDDDTWYWLEGAAGPAWLSFEANQSVGGASSATHATHFFTGSAPRVVGAEVSLKGSTSGPWKIRFSEPVELATLDTAKLLAENSQQITGSIYLNGSTGPAPSVRMDFVHFVPSKSVAAPGKPSTQHELGLNRKAVGSPRSVEAGAAASKDSIVADKLSVGSMTWFDCQKGSAKCWRESRSR